VIRAQGHAGMQKYLDQSIPLGDMIWRSMTNGKSFDRPEQRAALLNAIEKTVLQIADRNIQQSYRQILKDKFYQNANPKRRKNTQSSVPLSRPNANQDLSTRLILGMIIQYPALYDQYEEKLATFSCANPPLDALRQNVISILSDMRGITHDDLLEALENKGIEGDQIASLKKDMKLHASYVFNEDAREDIETGLKELLDRVAV
jgi:DNA primase